MSDDGEPVRVYDVPFQAYGSVYVKAESKEEAEELANERFGVDELARLGLFEGLDFNHKWGPGIDLTDEKEETPSPPELSEWYELRQWLGEVGGEWMRVDDARSGEPESYTAEGAALEALRIVRKENPGAAGDYFVARLTAEVVTPKAAP